MRQAAPSLARNAYSTAAALLIEPAVLHYYTLRQVVGPSPNFPCWAQFLILPRSAIAVVDSARSAVLAASSSPPPSRDAASAAPPDPLNVTTAADALAALRLHATELLDASKRLYDNGDLTGRLWEGTLVEEASYLPAGPRSPASAVTRQAAVWDAVALLVAKARLSHI
eukprot:tig00000157_g9595.t1